MERGGQRDRGAATAPPLPAAGGTTLVRSVTDWWTRRAGKADDEVPGPLDVRALYELLDEPAGGWTTVALVQVERFADSGSLDAEDRVVAAALVDHAGGRVYRIDPHTFAVIVDRPAGEVAAPLEALRHRLNRTLPTGTVVAGMATAVTGELLSEAFVRADTALREARSRGGVSVLCHQPDGATPVTVERARAVRALADGGPITIAYQPILRLDSNRLIGFEALMRPASDVGLVPAEIFAIAERIGLVAELDSACRQAVVDDAPGYDMPAHALLFVNVAHQAFVHPSFEPARFALALPEAGLTPDRVVLEVTEHPREDVGLLAAKADNVRAAGFRLALDNVGAASSGIDALRAVHAEFVKIDRAVIGAAASDARAFAALSMICTFANQVGSTVIAGGVENADVLAFVNRLSSTRLEPLRIDAAQGYHFGRPAPQPWRRQHAPEAP